MESAKDLVENEGDKTELEKKERQKLKEELDGIIENFLKYLALSEKFLPDIEKLVSKKGLELEKRHFEMIETQFKMLKGILKNFQKQK